MEQVLRQMRRTFDRVNNNVRLIRKYRDHYKLNAKILEDKIAIIQEFALEEIRNIDELLKKYEDEQNIKEHIET